MTAGPRLPRRLAAAFNLVPHAARSVADIGSGHGALALCLAATGRKVIATEAQDGPLRELFANLARWHAPQSVEVRKGDGLLPLRQHEVDGAIVAGMGARTALRICDAAPHKELRWMLLQCMQRQDEVEPWLERRRWTVLERAETLDRGRVYRTWLVAVA